MDEVLEQFDRTIHSIHSIVVTESTMARFKNLKNDEEKLKCVLHYLSDKTPLEFHQESKSAEKATKYIEKANESYSSKLWESLLGTYTQAVVYAPPDSSELARAFGNRSAVLYETEFYRDSILDIDRALSIGYPENTKTKLYVRKARCLLALDRKMSPGVKEALVEARKWLAKMDDANKKYMSNILDKITINSAKKKRHKIDCHKFFPQTPKDNPKIMGASEAIQIEYSEKFGRHITATRDINVGETLLVRKAYASVIEPNYLLDFCWNCSRKALSGVPCRECVTIIYCSETCRDMAWDDYHSIECPIIPVVLAHNMPINLLVLRLTVKACKKSSTFEKLKEKLVEIDAEEDPLIKIYDSDVFDDTKYGSVYTLLRGSPLLFGEVIKCAIILYCMAATTKIFGEKVSNFRDLLDNQSAIFIGELLMRHYSICEINSFATFINDNYGEMSRYGTTMNPLMNFFNHSCDPTAVVVAVKDISAVVAIERIKKDQQIFISYGPLYFDQKTDRRRKTIKSYHFICQCTACVENWGPFSYLSFPSYKAPSNSFLPDVEVILRRIHQECPDPFTCTMDIADIHSLISTVLDMIDVHQQATKYPTREMMMLKHGITTLFACVSMMLSVD